MSGYATANPTYFCYTLDAASLQVWGLLKTLFVRLRPACYPYIHSSQELMMPSSLRGLAAAVFLLCGLMSAPVWAGEVHAAVAANFAAPMERLAALFQKESGHTVKVSTAASTKLYAQIKAGA